MKKVAGYYETSTTAKDPDAVQAFADRHRIKMMKTIKKVAGDRFSELHIGKKPGFGYDQYDTFVTWSIVGPKDLMAKLEPLTNFLVEW
jgi:hypothetical protein